VLTSFLLWPLLLACVMVPDPYWTNLFSVGMYIAIIGLCCLTTATIALFCSVFFKKTAHSLMTTYFVIIVLFCLPLAMLFFAERFFAAAPATAWVKSLNMTSPFAAAFSVPMRFGNPSEMPHRAGDALLYVSYVGFSAGLLIVLMGLIIWLFNTRWRVAQ
jgi:ABC-type transport system involved in multi-copper enzyme maturation permease subunit